MAPGLDAYSSKPIMRVKEREVYSNRFVTIFDDDIVTRGGQAGRYMRIEESGGRPGVAMLAECTGSFALVRTFRYALDEWEWGVPRGFAHGDDPLESVRGELREELGGAARQLVSLGEVSPNSGLLTSRVRMYYAFFDDRAATPEDTEEVAEVRWVSKNELFSGIAKGEIIDAFTLSAVAAAVARGMIRYIPN